MGKYRLKIQVILQDILITLPYMFQFRSFMSKFF